MKKLLKYQRKFLTLLLCKSNPLQKSEFESWFGNDIGQWSWVKVSRAGKLTKNFGNYTKAVADYASSDRVGITNVLTTIRHDHQFPFKRANPHFAFKFTHLSDEWKEVLTPFLIAFYDILHTKVGYPADKFGFSQGNLNWRSFMNAQDKANPYVCSYCDDASGDKTEKLDANDAEHWLPKSIYPHLSIHWANLFRACLACNRTFKGDDNPIKHVGAKELENTYHPYDKPALDTAQVKASIYTANPKHYFLTLEDRINPTCATEIDSLLDLSERWRGRMKNELQGDKSSLVASNIQIMVNNRTFNESLLRDALTDQLNQNKSKVRLKPNALLKEAVLSYQLNHELNEIYTALSSTHR